MAEAVNKPGKVKLMPEETKKRKRESDKTRAEKNRCHSDAGPL